MSKVPLTILSLAALAAGAGQAWAQPAPKGDVAKGKELFVQFSCAACHGTRGSNGPGGPIAGAALFPEAAILHQVRTPRRQMPAYPAAELSDKDVQDIHAYLQTIPRSPEAKDIAILNR